MITSWFDINTCLSDEILLHFMKFNYSTLKIKGAAKYTISQYNKKIHRCVLIALLKQRGDESISD